MILEGMEVDIEAFMQVLVREAQADMRLNNEMQALWLNQIDNEDGNHGVVNGEWTGC
jgi:hypothetical protein